MRPRRQSTLGRVAFVDESENCSSGFPETILTQLRFTVVSRSRRESYSIDFQEAYVASCIAISIDRSGRVFARSLLAPEPTYNELSCSKSCPQGFHNTRDELGASMHGLLADELGRCFRLPNSKASAEGEEGGASSSSNYAPPLRRAHSRRNNIELKSDYCCCFRSRLEHVLPPRRTVLLSYSITSWVGWLVRSFTFFPSVLDIFVRLPFHTRCTDFPACSRDSLLSGGFHPYKVLSAVAAA